MSWIHKILPVSGWGAVIFTGLLLSGGLSGCGGSSASLPAYERKTSVSQNSSARRLPLERPVRLGRVSMINTEEEFALIELSSPLMPKEQTTLYAFKNQMRSAQLKVSGERQTPFLIADIVEGHPSQNDLVYLLPRDPNTRRSGGSGGGGGGSSRPSYSSYSGGDDSLPSQGGAIDAIDAVDLLGDDIDYSEFLEEAGPMSEAGEIDPDAPAALLDPAPGSEEAALDADALEDAADAAAGE